MGDTTFVTQRTSRRLAQIFPSLGDCATCLGNRTTQLKLPSHAQAHMVTPTCHVSNRAGLSLPKKPETLELGSTQLVEGAQISTEPITIEKGCHRTSGRHMLPAEFL